MRSSFEMSAFCGIAVVYTAAWRIRELFDFTPAWVDRFGLSLPAWHSLQLVEMNACPKLAYVSEVSQVSWDSVIPVDWAPVQAEVASAAMNNKDRMNQCARSRRDLHVTITSDVER